MKNIIDKSNEYQKDFYGKTLFLLGDEACAEAAIFAGCRFFAGYPITPATEIAETMALRLPMVGGYYLQMEDEIASIAAMIGASWGGLKSMTATSGPGFSLMQENLGYAVMTETPCVIVDIQRSGPSTGGATLPAQGDVMQARWGTHGDHEIIALAPNSVQEMFDLTVEAFNLSEKYRNPVILLADGEIGHIREKVRIPFPEEVDLIDRAKADEGMKGVDFFPFGGGREIPLTGNFGEGRALHVTGSHHMATGLRTMAPTKEEIEALVGRLSSKISNHRLKLAMTEQRFLEDAEIVVVSYGAPSRPSLGAVLKAQSEGCRAGFLRLKTIWPFPAQVVAELPKTVRHIIVVEMNLGQIVREVERVVCPDQVTTHLLSAIGGTVHNTGEIYQRIRELV
jgi:2-oxoglutarate ferredoxin oxidoreductase subunit alpha